MKSVLNPWNFLFACVVLMLVLRVVDFIDEAQQLGFQMTRMGMHLDGLGAMVLQLLIIAVLSALSLRVYARIR